MAEAGDLKSLQCRFESCVEHFYFTLYAMFMYWLMEQEDRDDEIGVLYRTIFKDYNNGCLPAITDVKKIAEHFISHHPATFFDMKDQLALAIKAYAEGPER